MSSRASGTSSCRAARPFSAQTHSIGSPITPISLSCSVRRMVIAISSAPALNASVSSADRPTRSSRRTFACVLAKSRSRSGRPASAKSCVVPIDTRPSARAPLRLSQASRCAARMRRAWPTRSSPAAVSSRPRPWRTSSGSPITSSSRCICAVTADGERPTTDDARASEPLSTKARKVRSRSGSMVSILPRYQTIHAKQFDFFDLWFMQMSLRTARRGRQRQGDKPCPSSMSP